MGITDRYWMQQALEMAFIAQKEGEVPIGAILVDTNNKCIGQGWNRVVQTKNPLAHAELVAIHAATANMGNYRLSETTLYVTLEPCTMCAGAIVHARIKRLVFATRDFKGGAAGSCYNLLRGLHTNHAVRIDEGILQVESARLLNDFFIERR